MPEQVTEQMPATPFAESEIPVKEVLLDKATMIDAQGMTSFDFYGLYYLFTKSLFS